MKLIFTLKLLTNNMVTVKTLKDKQILISAKNGILVCDVGCGAEYSANINDYSSYPEDHVFECCDKPMWLCVKEIHYVDFDFEF